jgi:hypothetical protein
MLWGISSSGCYDLAASKSQVDYSKWGEPVDIKALARSA